ncbi:Gfo/Idh/MocA family oxidoreductase [Streptomyces sp. NPDC001833]|uniref:Gfo/Idh/MocA family protein n=1 Tax=Streptomyces sp. NPDC001833 TaxID=3154658 RepID=UPI00331E02E2
MPADPGPDPGPGASPSRPRLAVLGTAHPHLADHLRALTGRAEVVAVHEGRLPWGGAGPHPGLRGVPVVPDAAAALAGAQLALVCATTAEHPELLTAVARAGLPVLVEKPLAAGLAGTQELADRLAAAGTAVTTAMFLRCAPALRRARSLLAEGRLGRLVACDAWFTHPGLLDGLFTDAGAAWMRDARWGARGAFADLGVHLVDLLRWLRPEAGLRVRGAVLHPPPDGLPGDAGGTALLDWGAVPAALHAGWLSRPGGVRLRLEGTRGTLQVAGGELTLATADGTLTEAHRPPAAGDAMIAFLTGAGELADAADAVACARVLEEIAGAAVRG